MAPGGNQAERRREDDQAGSGWSGGAVRVLVVDDHRSYAEALSLAISLEPGFSSVGHTDTVESAVRTVAAEHPQVVILDWQLPDVDGVEGVRRIKVADPAARVVMITGHAERGLQRLAQMAGASAFLPKESSVAEIIDTVRKCMLGSSFIGMLAEDPKEDRIGEATLSPREVEVLWLLAKGRDTPSIAATLFLSVHTIRGYVKDLLRKLGAHSQLEAVAIARRRGLLPDKPP